MNAYGFDVTQEQQDAGMSVMNGRFSAKKVQAALESAGVPVLWQLEYLSYRVADRLLSRQKRKGLVRYVGRGTWESQQ